ncbi:fungal pheromone STE3G-protein-coupled receptor [Schizopora paradoxa]|uniref:Fungal pheromone STE3G-protein-coupled receptor n=1 Tax=Schizopora paradoxa TaxID=27342 RepID=A0A0H2R833_9AGAM|nr:fungal pheromone STE3G-protein-coupled receptor [Schizopora paradoxa]
MYALTPYPITPIGNFIGVVLALLPLFCQIRKLSLAVWGYALWIASTNFIMFVNTIIWHDNIKIVASVWCDIVTKLIIGAGVGTRACALIICVHVYRMASLKRSLATTSCSQLQRRRPAALICEILLIVGLPILVMALYIIVQPVRFIIYEEMGCSFAEYSFVGYIIYYAPVLVTNLISAFLTLIACTKFREGPKKDSIFKCDGQEPDVETTSSKLEFKRLLVIACLDTAFNLPVLILITIYSVVSGSNDSLNYPYISWKNVHDGAGGNFPGTSLSTIMQVPASDWGTDGWNIFNVKWDEWLYVAHAIMFFSVFGTTPQMRKYYCAMLWYIPERLGYKRRVQVDSRGLCTSAMKFSPNPNEEKENRRMELK